MSTDLELMNVHVRALFTQDAESRLLFVNEPGGATAPAPRMFLGRTRTGNVWRFRADLPENLIKELDALCADEPVSTEFNELPRHVETYERLLEKHAPVREASNGLAYRFTEYDDATSRPLTVITERNAEMLQGGFEDLIADVSAEQPFVAIVVEDRAVSVCRSVRITSEAHEAGLETLPDFRGRGLAKDVVARWAHLVRATGAMPLYSTSWENTASQAVARKMGLQCYGTDFQIT